MKHHLACVWQAWSTEPMSRLASKSLSSSTNTTHHCLTFFMTTSNWLTCAKWCRSSTRDWRCWTPNWSSALSRVSPNSHNWASSLLSTTWWMSPWFHSSQLSVASLSTNLWQHFTKILNFWLKRMTSVTRRCMPSSKTGMTATTSPNNLKRFTTPLA